MSPERARELTPSVEGIELAKQQQLTRILEAGLVMIPKIPVPPPRQQVAHVITHAVQQVSDGQIASFARALGVSRKMVIGWANGANLPNLEQLLRFCCLLDLSLSDVLLSETSTLRPHLTTSILLDVAKRPFKSPISVSLRDTLEEILSGEEEPVPSMKEVARRLGYHPQSLARRHREVCHAISARYQAYLHKRREERLQRQRDEIRQATLKVAASGQSLRRKHVAAHLSKPGNFRDPEMRAVLREILLELP